MSDDFSRLLVATLLLAFSFRLCCDSSSEDHSATDINYSLLNAIFSPLTAVDKSAMKMLIHNNPATCLVTKEIKCNEYLQGDQETSITPHSI
jgi:hypothetical protein